MAKLLGDNFGHRPKGARASLAGSDFVVDALDKRCHALDMTYLFFMVAKLKAGDSILNKVALQEYPYQ